MLREANAIVEHLLGTSAEPTDVQSQIAALRRKLDTLERRFAGSQHSAHAHWVRAMRRARGRREAVFAGELFADPAWDILLELYDVHLEQKRTSVSKVCHASGVPGTTALRWIEKLIQDGLVVRQNDPLDRRRVWVSLSDEGAARMREFFDGFPDVLGCGNLAH